MEDTFNHPLNMKTYKHKQPIMSTLQEDIKHRMKIISVLLQVGKHPFISIGLIEAGSLWHFVQNTYATFYSDI